MSELLRAIEYLKNGKMVILVDDEERENEGDLVMAAQFVTPEAINFLAREARGLICMPMDESRIKELQLPMMTQNNQSPRSTGFTVSIEARSGVTTGISAADRARTIQVAADPSCKSEDLLTPGHVFPLRALSGGVLVRAGHTEGSLDLMRAADLRPAAVICEIMNEDGSMARRSDLEVFSKKHGQLPIVTIRELIAYRMTKETLVEKAATTRLPTSFGEFTMHAFINKIDGSEHLALVKGQIENPTLVRVHSECLTGDALGSLRCDCGPQLQRALRQIADNGSGVLVYMRRHEGRGIGLINKIRAYELQDQGLDTVEANRHLGFQADLRQYGIGAQILRQLGVRRFKLITNNPKKVIGLDGFDLEIIEQVPIEMPANVHNEFYLKTKKEKLGHHLTLASNGELH